MLTLLGLASGLAGVFVAVLILLYGRFGPGSWLLGCLLGVSSVAAAAPAIAVFSSGPAPEGTIRLAFASLLMAAPLGVLVTWTLGRQDYLAVLRLKRKLMLPVLLPAPLLAALLYLLPAVISEDRAIPPGFIALGPGGYLSAIYILVLSVMALAGLEQIVRGTDERVKWEIKFLVLGLAAFFASVIYLASKVLLYSFSYALLPLDSLRIFPIIFMVTCALVFASWRRSSGGTRIVVSQSFVYSTITLLSVGVYLIASGLLARWASRWGVPGIETEALVFLLSAVALATILLWTGFRQKARGWIQRNVFAGKFDYRHYWMEATEQIRSVDGVQQASTALAQIVHRALGSINVSVWLRAWDPNRLHMLYSVGHFAEPVGPEVHGIVESLLKLSEPVSIVELGAEPEMAVVIEFMRKTRASLLAPLCSAGRIVGLLTVGPDRSGRNYDHEAREFLRVVAAHAASEFHKSELLATLVAAKEAEAFRTFSTFLLHDLKNFASTLSLIAKNAARHQDNPDFQRDAVKSVFETSEKIKKLCNTLRTFSSAPAADRKPEDLNRIVRTVVDESGAGAGGNLHLSLDSLPPALIDAEGIVRVIQNLLLNAREAIAPEGTIIISTACKDGRIELAVQDDGRGMSAEFLEKNLFQPFQTTKSSGMGIGLYQTKRIVEAHRGTIKVTSEEGKGTLVRVSLPASSQEQTSVRQ
jgi:putative PEP-CTERM system histidine kinase